MCKLVFALAGSSACLCFPYPPPHPFSLVYHLPSEHSTSNGRNMTKAPKCLYTHITDISTISHSGQV